MPARYWPGAGFYRNKKKGNPEGGRWHPNPPPLPKGGGVGPPPPPLSFAPRPSFSVEVVSRKIRSRGRDTPDPPPRIEGDFPRHPTPTPFLLVQPWPGEIPDPQTSQQRANQIAVSKRAVGFPSEGPNRLPLFISNPISTSLLIPTYLLLY